MGARLVRGFSLIDVLVAIMLLAISGTSLVILMGQTAQTMRTLDRADRASLEASRQLDRLAAMSRERLLECIGRTHPSGWTVDVSQPAPALFDASVAESDTTPPLLRTTFYRPDSVHAP